MCKHQLSDNRPLQQPVPACDHLLIPAARLAKWTRRGFACFMVLLVVLQSVLMPAQRTAERAHFHVARFDTGSVGQSQVIADLDSNHFESSKLIQRHRSGHDDDGEGDHQHEATQGLFRHKRDHPKDHDSAHQHTHMAVHEHAQSRGDVVYVEAHESGSAAGSSPTPKRLAFDFEAVLRREPALPTVTRHKAPDTEVALSFLSHTELPLERPPRTRA